MIFCINFSLMYKWQRLKSLVTEPHSAFSCSWIAPFTLLDSFAMDRISFPENTAFLFHMNSEK